MTRKDWYREYRNTLNTAAELLRDGKDREAYLLIINELNKSSTHEIKTDEDQISIPT